MATIIRGTTPTITFTFSDFNATDIVEAVFVIKQGGNTILQMDLSEADVDESTLTWYLTQENTFLLNSALGGIIVCDWLLDNGIRGRSEVFSFAVDNPAVEEILGEVEDGQ